MANDSTKTTTPATATMTTPATQTSGNVQEQQTAPVPNVPQVTFAISEAPNGAGGVSPFLFITNVDGKVYQVGVSEVHDR